jgi:hypothetical protein
MAAVTWNHLRLAAGAEVAPAAALVENGRYLALALPADLRERGERARREDRPMSVRIER